MRHELNIRVKIFYFLSSFGVSYGLRNLTLEIFEASKD
jgi:hypothetical protein